MARRRIITVYPDLVVRWLQQDGTAVAMTPGVWIKSITSDCPADLRIVGCGWDEARGVMRIAVESESFDEVPDGCFAPEWTPTYTQHFLSRYDAAMEVLGLSAS